MLEARAVNKYIGSSPRKMRLVIDLIRGKSVDEAISMLHYTPKHAARVAEQVLRSAVSNIHGKDEGSRLEAGDLFVKEAFVNGGPSAKRSLPATMGRAYKMLKRSNHVTIIVAQKPQKNQTPAAVKSKEAKAGKADKTIQPQETTKA